MRRLCSLQEARPLVTRNQRRRAKKRAAAAGGARGSEVGQAGPSHDVLRGVQLPPPGQSGQGPQPGLPRSRRALERACKLQRKRAQVATVGTQCSPPPREPVQEPMEITFLSALSGPPERGEEEVEFNLDEEIRLLDLENVPLGQLPGPLSPEVQAPTLSEARDLRISFNEYMGA